MVSEPKALWFLLFHLLENKSTLQKDFWISSEVFSAARQKSTEAESDHWSDSSTTSKDIPLYCYGRFKQIFTTHIARRITKFKKFIGIFDSTKLMLTKPEKHFSYWEQIRICVILKATNHYDNENSVIIQSRHKFRHTYASSKSITFIATSLFSSLSNLQCKNGKKNPTLVHER